MNQNYKINLIRPHESVATLRIYGDVMTETEQKLELAKNIRESLAARKIGGTGIELNSEEVDLVYEILNDYVMRNDEASVDVQLPFDVIQSLGEVS